MTEAAQAMTDQPGGPSTTTPAQPTAGGRSLWNDAWRELRRNPLFWAASVLILVFVVMAIAPQLFTSTDPTYADLSKARQPPQPGHPFGFNGQGYDVYARTIHGARASILVGLFTSAATVVIGSAIGLISGYFGGWIDSLLSRLGEIFLSIPTLLAGVLFLYTFPAKPGDNFFIVIGKVVLVLMLFGWPSIARLMRSAVLQVKPNDYVTAARALGATPFRVIMTHVLPNALAPVLVVATINLGAYITAEASLSFLGIGLQPPAVSWGIEISNGSALGLLRSAPHMLLFPSIFLSLTVLAFIMMGDAVRDALDPKAR